ncbi:MAG: hydrogenase expression/formation protein HypE [Dysgonamonadaceae bacterium]|jgi:hydrogenase expression/formation protein HypE|nr:hydrogenase expression/formation protein HypE [Dysgonamonadaceae bacterium]
MDEIITLQHGSGGEATDKLINNIIFRYLGNDILREKHDGAFLNLSGKLAFSTDSYVVSPIFFEGGNIGELAVNGTVNDLAMCGAMAKYLSLSFIIEEGLPMVDFEKILASIKAAADKAEVQVVTGDTKVVERGKGDKIYINTSGIGVINPKSNINIRNIKNGDLILTNASIASHGMAIMSRREGLQFESDISSDTQNLNFTVRELIEKFGDKIHFLRDATRGGLASILFEIVSGSPFGIQISEEKIPVANAVRSACELLGLDPIYVANEGVFVCIVERKIADEALSVLKKKNEQASLIGKITTDHAGKVITINPFGGRRNIHPLIGEQMPRIC